MSHFIQRTPRSGLPSDAIHHPAEIEAENRLHQSAYSPLRRVTCQVHGQEITIRGRVPTYYLKQVAQSLLSGLDGIRTIDNRLDVASFSREQ
jgi:osmotically-inducible protein OsmY